MKKQIGKSGQYSDYDLTSGKLQVYGGTDKNTKNAEARTACFQAEIWNKDFSNGKRCSDYFICEEIVR